LNLYGWRLTGYCLYWEKTVASQTRNILSLLSGFRRRKLENPSHDIVNGAISGEIDFVNRAKKTFLSKLKALFNRFMKH